MLWGEVYKAVWAPAFWDSRALWEWVTVQRATTAAAAAAACTGGEEGRVSLWARVVWHRGGG